MVVFLERRHFEEDLSDRLSEEEYVAQMKKAVMQHHQHRDGSEVELRMIGGKEAAPIKKMEEQNFSDSKHQKDEAVVFACCCGQDLLAKRNSNGLSIATYLPKGKDLNYGEKSSGYTVGSNSVNYGR